MISHLYPDIAPVISGLSGAGLRVERCSVPQSINSLRPAMYMNIGNRRMEGRGGHSRKIALVYEGQKIQIGHRSQLSLS